MVPCLFMGFVKFDCEFIFFETSSVEMQGDLDLNCVPPKKICFYLTRYQPTWHYFKLNLQFVFRSLAVFI